MTTTLTIEQALALAAILKQPSAVGQPHQASACDTTPFPAVVCTDKRGVVFGYITDANADPMVVQNARMCLRWSTKVGGVFGLAEKGPYDASKSGETTVSATVTSVTLRGITAVFSCDEIAEKAWLTAPIVGR